MLLLFEKKRGNIVLANSSPLLIPVNLIKLKREERNKQNKENLYIEKEKEDDS